MEDVSMDMAYLDDETQGSFDLNHFVERPDALFTFNVILIANNEPDIQILEFNCDTEVSIYIQENFKTEAIQTIVKNKHEESMAMCPYFRIVMDDYDDESAINFKLYTMFKRMGIQSISPRCSKAMIVGLTALNHLDSPLSVPYCFMTTTVDPSDFISAEDEIDVACLKPCAQKLNPDATDLCDIAGMTIPYYLPQDVQFLILSFCKSPTASLISTKIDNICFAWDVFLYPMFLQREPRIPYLLASYYNASTVQSAAAGATRPFLVPTASRTTNVVFPRWMMSL
jgi:hypothetical protein